MIYHDLCIAWNWEYDADFVAFLEAACYEHGRSLLQITPDNLASTLQALHSGELAFCALLDRACDDDPQFLPIVEWTRERRVWNINPLEKARHAWDKTAMHEEFINAGLHVPYAVILPPLSAQPQLAHLDLGVLGPSFSIKPACRGGGEGVINRATSLEEVLAARQQYPQDKYLLQAHVTPAQQGGQPAWFRVIYCAGQVYACRWDVETHVYTPLHHSEETEPAIVGLCDLSARIASICALGLFSTEIALTVDGDLIVVDYVNDPLDLRLQSKAADGVPDDVVRAIAERLGSLATCKP